ncbi:MAG: CHAD domain-containing protein [Gammaproteobacteria bacterium]
MRAELAPSQPLPAALRRVAARELAAARGALVAPPAGDVHAGVHAARKALKRLRALLRLARPVLGRDVYKRENARLRDAGRCLAAVRDAHALVETFDLLESQHARRVEFARMLPLRSALTQAANALMLPPGAADANLARAVALLDATAAAVPDWPLAGADAKQLAKGLGRTHRRARREWKQARRCHDPAVLHQWRKRAKYLRHMYELVTDVDDGAAARRRDACHALSDILGDHHDLEVLRARLDTLPRSPLGAVAESELRVLMREHQDSLYAQALALGESLLRVKPGKVRRQVRKRLGRALVG